MTKKNALLASTVIGFALTLGSTVTAFAASHGDLQAPRGQDTERPRGHELQAPRGQAATDQAPRGQDTERPRGAGDERPRSESR
jgi:hypothetical protein